MKALNRFPIPSPPALLLWGAGMYALTYGFRPMLDQIAQYFLLRDDIGFLRIKTEVLQLPFWKLAFYVHVYSSIFSLMAGFTQFLPVRRPSIRGLHRWMGKLYVGTVLGLAAPSGLVLALFAQGGLAGRIGFTFLALGWLASTYLAYRAVRRREYITHRDWMIRSYALTFSAITLREWQYWFAILLPPHWDTFALVAWLGWAPNLLAAEGVIRFCLRKDI